MSFDLTLRLASHLGVPFDFDPDARGPVFDGDCIHLAHVPGDAGLAHELAHYLVAAPWRRFEANYGLGHDPYGGSFARCLVGPLVVEREERLAVALGVAINRALSRDARPLWEYHAAAGHGWSLAPYWAAYEALERRGLTAGGVPVCVNDLFATHEYDPNAPTTVQAPLFSRGTLPRSRAARSVSSLGHAHVQTGTERSGRAWTGARPHEPHARQRDGNQATR